MCVCIYSGKISVQVLSNSEFDTAADENRNADLFTHFKVSATAHEFSDNAIKQQNRISFSKFKSQKRKISRR